MKILNYLDLNNLLIYLRFQQDRTKEFKEFYHAHQGIEFLYVHTGSGHVIIDKHIYNIRAGNLMFFRPFQLHRVSMEIGPDSPYVRSLFIFEPHILRNYLAPFPVLREMFEDLCVHGEMSQVLQVEEGEMNSLFDLYRKRIEEARTGDLLEIQALFLVSFLTILMPKWRQTLRLERALPSTAESIMHWIDLNYMEPFELDKLAKAVHLSPVHVSALFRRTVGSSITEYLTARRIRQACLLLKKEKLNVGEIGEAVGITNISYFCQFFKKNVGISPHQYKKQFSTQ